MADKKIWYVYMHTNKINNKKYIGITGGKNCSYRWHKNGSGYKRQIFGKAIEKYGWDNFEHEILCVCDNYDKACENEIKYIKKYQTADRKYGYNMSTGGEIGSLGALNNRLSKKVYMYDIDGNFIREFPSMMEAERITGISNSLICACCKGKFAYIKNHIWSYEKKNKISGIDKEKYLYEKVRKEQQKEVYQYSLDGKYICSFASLREASQQTGVDFRSISSCCLGIISNSHGYIWTYKYYDSMDDLCNRKNNIVKKGKPVLQYDKDLTLLCRYESIMDAVRNTNISKGKISRCCNHKINNVDDKYIFCFDKEETNNVI